MTRNNAQKKTIRERMALTGESYAVAMRKLEAHAPLPEIVIWELDEDGDTWFIEGTLDVSAGRQALQKWFLEVYGPDSEVVIDWMTNMLPVIQAATPQVSTNWFWKPFYPEYPDDSWYLRSKEKEPDMYAGETLMTGLLFHGMPEYNPTPASPEIMDWSLFAQK